VQASLFISEIPAERRWVMSGTPTVGDRDFESLEQLGRLLSFLRHPIFGGSNGLEWQKQVLKPFKQSQRKGRIDAGMVAVVKSVVVSTLIPLCVRHTKKDVSLPAPVEKEMWDGVLEPIQSQGPENETCVTCMNGQLLKKGVACPAHCNAQCVSRSACNMHCNRMCRWLYYGEASWTRRTTENVANHIMAVMTPERAAYAQRKKRATAMHAVWPSTLAMGKSELRPPKVSDSTAAQPYSTYCAKHAFLTALLLLTIRRSSSRSSRMTSTSSQTSCLDTQQQARRRWLDTGASTEARHFLLSAMVRACISSSARIVSRWSY
jgi:hypothetical protein